MVTRRTLVRAVGASVMAGIGGGMAGCVGDDATDDTDGDDEVDAEPGNGEEELREAREQLGSVAEDMRALIEDEVEPGDIDPERALEEVSDTLSDAGTVVTEDQERQHESLETLHDVLADVVGTMEAFEAGIQALERGLLAHERTEEHEVEVRIDEHGNVLNPVEMGEMQCGTIGELRDAIGHYDDAVTHFEEGVSTLDGAVSELETIEAELEEYEEIDEAAVRTAVHGPMGMMTGFSALSRGLKLNAQGELASHEAGLKWDLAWNPNIPDASDMFPCEHVSFTGADIPVVPLLEGGTSIPTWMDYLDNTIQPKYEEARDLLAEGADTLEGIDTDALDPEATHLVGMSGCFARFGADATAHRVKAIDGRLQAWDEEPEKIGTGEGEGESAYAEYTNEAFDLDDEAVRDCQ